MSTTKHENHGAVAGQVDCRVRPPRKADMARLEMLLHDWRSQEANLARHGLAVVPGSMRAKKLKDAAALQTAIAYLRLHIDAGKRPNVGAKLPATAAPAHGNETL